MPDPGRRTNHEVDVVAFGDEAGREVLALGEATWGRVMTVADVERLRRIRELASARPSVNASTAHLVLFSGAGFSPDLREVASEEDVVLVDLDRLYYGE